MRNYKKLEAWTHSLQLATSVYTFTASLPNEERFGLVSQLNRAAVSVPSNIAEGCSRSSKKHFIVYLENALGSLFELETQVLICKNTRLATEQACSDLLNDIKSSQRLVYAFWKSIQADIK